MRGTLGPHARFEWYAKTEAGDAHNIGIEISGPGGSAQLIVDPADRVVSTRWHHFSASLDPAEWQITSGTWNALLSNVTQLAVDLDIRDETGAEASLDDFMLIGAAQAASVPVTVRVDDGRGGYDTQSFTIDVLAEPAGEIHGTKFHDLDADGTRDTVPMLYVSDSPANKVYRYDALTAEFIDVFVSGSDVGAFALGPDGNIYATSYYSNRIVRFDGETGEFIDVFVTAIPQPTNLVFGADQNLYVTSYGWDRVDRYDGTSGAHLDVFASYDGMENPLDLTFGPDGNLYVSNYLEGNIPRFDGITGELIDVFVPVGSGGLDGPAGLTFGPDGDLYVCDMLPPDGPPAVRRYDGETGAPLGDVTSGNELSPRSFDVAFGPSGDLYVAGFGNDVRRFNGTTGAFIEYFVPPGEGGLSQATWMMFTENIEPVLPGWVIYLDQNRNGQRDLTECAI